MSQRSTETTNMCERYTIRLIAYNIDEDGYLEDEIESNSIDYATTNLDNILGLMDYFLRMINEGFAERVFNDDEVERRFPEDEA